MTSEEVAETLERAQAALDRGDGLDGTGFWKAVAAAKGDPALVEQYGDRIGAIDRSAFERWALVTVPAPVGTSLMVAGTAVGLGLVWWAYGANRPLNGVLLLAGMLVTLVTTHGLGHSGCGGVGRDASHPLVHRNRHATSARGEDRLRRLSAGRRGGSGEHARDRGRCHQTRPVPRPPTRPGGGRTWDRPDRHRRVVVDEVLGLEADPTRDAIPLTSASGATVVCRATIPHSPIGDEIDTLTVDSVPKSGGQSLVSNASTSSATSLRPVPSAPIAHSSSASRNRTSSPSHPAP